MTQPHEGATDELTSKLYIAELTQLRAIIADLRERLYRVDAEAAGLKVIAEGQTDTIANLQQHLGRAVHANQALRVENAELRVVDDRRTRQVLVISDPMGEVGL